MLASYGIKIIACNRYNIVSIKEKRKGERKNESKKLDIVFWRKNYNPCGSDGAIPSEYSQNTIVKKINSKEIFIPAWAKSYIILPNIKFLNMDYDSIHNYHRHYAKIIIKGERKWKK